jgi:hypothetical protein
VSSWASRNAPAIAITLSIADHDLNPAIDDEVASIHARADR